jgi:hypothetical protein
MNNEGKMKYRESLPKVLGILIAIIFAGCQKVIIIDLNEVAPQTVIEGLITDRTGPYIVKISKSGSYFNQPVLPPVSGALVIITDDARITDTLRETKPGIYQTSKTRGIPGRTYNLKVISENIEYTGSSTMHSHVNIDSLSLVRSTTHYIGLGNDSKVEINVDLHCFFRDPVEKNFYRIKVTRNDTIRSEDYRLYDDQYTNGQETELRVTHAKAGDRDRIELYSLDMQTYGYYRTLEDLLYTNPIFGSTPANPNTNLSNGALGYFGACAVASKTVVITNTLINSVK